MNQIPSALDAPAVESLVPHRGTMSLLDRVLAVDEEQALAEVDVGPASLFAQADGVPAWVGIEYMAQTVAAWAGAARACRGSCRLERCASARVAN